MAMRAVRRRGISLLGLARERAGSVSLGISDAFLLAGEPGALGLEMGAPCWVAESLEGKEASFVEVAVYLRCLRKCAQPVFRGREVLSIQSTSSAPI